MLGDCRESLRTLPPASVQSVITSPPYYGLRDYGLPPLVWGGDPDHAHDWLQVNGVWDPGGRGETARLSSTLVDSAIERQHAGSATKTGFGSHCSCGAWRGSHGLEPTPELYIQHEVEIFREVRRVLRDDGTLWLNLGDSYAGSGKGPSNGLSGLDGSASPHSHIAAMTMARENGGLSNRSVSGHRNGAGPVTGYKPKDLMLLPFRVALALQQDGWYVRSTIPWLKRNSMPESVTDRPSTSVEYVFLLAKSARYFWHPDAVRMHASLTTHSRGTGDGGPKMREKAATLGMHDGWGDATREVLTNRNRRNSDWFFESWQGLLLDDCDQPQALLVNPQPFAGAHFATFPPKLVEPMVKASTRSGETVLDPFAGAGTVGLVADRLDRDAILMDLKPDYHLMASTRVVQDAPMFVQLEAGL